MSIAAMAEVAEVGSSWGWRIERTVVQRWNGVKYEKPYARTRDVLRFVKQALDGEKIDEIFETFEVHGFKLSRPSWCVRRSCSGTAPGMLRLAGREADGAILNWLGPMTSRSVGPRSARERRSRRDSSSCPRPTPTSRE